jgi:hypothetical protein
VNGRFVRIFDYTEQPPMVDPRAGIHAGATKEIDVEPSIEIAPNVEPVTQDRTKQGFTGRLAALVLLVATVGGLGWAGTQIYYVITDGWIAPLHLSPDSDAVTQLRLTHQRHLSELSRLDAEITRLDGELAAIEGAVTKLSALRNSSQETLAWGAEQSQIETRGLDDAIASYARQHVTLGELYARQQDLVARAAEDLEAGMIDRTAYDREQQVRDQLALALGENEREAAQARVQRAHSRAALHALRAGTGLKTQVGSGAAQMPEVAAGAEHAARVEVELQRLLAEARGQRALREAAIAAVSSQRALLAEIEARPLYRAMTVATDIGFVPYKQLAGMHPGDSIVQCTWGVFRCHEVGRVTEIVPGEVVTQDPWGELARGQYIVLALDDGSAVRERVLRVRH